MAFWVATSLREEGERRLFSVLQPRIVVAVDDANERRLHRRSWSGCYIAL